MKSLHQQDKDLIWHPYTQHLVEPEPILIERAKGASLFTSEGNEVLDLISSWWTTTHGHSHEKLNQAIINQAEKLDHVMFAGFSHPPAIKLATELITVLPKNLKKVFFSDNGSTAVEVAIKIALQYWKNRGYSTKNKLVALDGGYHGDTVGAMSVSKGSGFFNSYKDYLFSIEVIPFPETWIQDDERLEKEATSLSYFMKLIEEKKQDLCAIIIEPLLQGAGGMRVCSVEYVRKLSQIAKENDILLIFDEVAVGFGRLGEMFACNKSACEPDIICLSKGLTAGYLPMAATVCTDEIYNNFLSQKIHKTLLHGHTFTANPLACAVAHKSLKLFQEEQTLKKIAHIEKKHVDFSQVLLKTNSIFKLRQVGSVLAFDIQSKKNNYKNNLSEKLRFLFLSQGFNIRPIGSSIYLMPPYCISDKELDRTYDVIFKTITSLPTI